MKIRGEQLAAFAGLKQATFQRRMEQHLLERFSRHLLRLRVARSEIPTLVRQGLERARAYGLEYEFDLKRYVECLALLGRDFDRDPACPWAREILTRRDWSGRMKMDALDEHLVFAAPGAR
jgi:hypothetical protein